MLINRMRACVRAGNDVIIETVKRRRVSKNPSQKVRSGGVSQRKNRSASVSNKNKNKEGAQENEETKRGENRNRSEQASKPLRTKEQIDKIHKPQDQSIREKKKNTCNHLPSVIF
jgi:hypothetical protein